MFDNLVTIYYSAEVVIFNEEVVKYLVLSFQD